MTGGRLAPCLMVQGTGSSVGKSVLATAFCRLFARSGYRVAPFKAQNMALNSAVTAEGGEIGRAQAVQAEAAGVDPTVDMNPILLKPEEDFRSQVVVRGQVHASLTYREYNRLKPELLAVVRECLERLRRRYDLIVIEGAGSPAEVNLKADEIVNMRIARLADAPVLLVGDIDRGGVFASFVGTLDLLEPEERRLVRGFVINKFRGDASLLKPGLEFLERRTGISVLGVVPYFRDIYVAAEDSVSLEEGGGHVGGDYLLDVAVVRLPRISNFDEFEPLIQEPGVRVRFIRGPHEINGADVIILPGTKSTVTDLAFLRTSGLADMIGARATSGTPVLGICGGYQMLGREIRDPEGVESSQAAVPGLGLLPVVTTFLPRKTTQRIRGRVVPGVALFEAASGEALQAYEIHMGQGASEGTRNPFLITERQGQPVTHPDGAVNEAGNVLGTYLHGLFHNAPLRRAFLCSLARRKGVAVNPLWGSLPDTGSQYDRLADLVQIHLDVPRIATMVGLHMPARPVVRGSWPAEKIPGMNLSVIQSRIPQPDADVMEGARRRQRALTKPPGSLGRLEELSVLLAGMTGQTRFRFDRKAVIVMAADHGVVAEGVSAYPAEVTAQMVANFARGGAAINVLARAVGARVITVDMGVRTPLAALPNVRSLRVGAGTRNFLHEPAMTREEAVCAIEAGIVVALEERSRGLDLVATGDMGIGNTTAASAITAVLTGCTPVQVTGPGTGLEPPRITQKVRVIEKALERHRPDPPYAVDVLSKVGGFEIGGLAGVILGGAAHRIPVVLDGFIAAAAALLAVRLAPEARAFLIAGHRSAEPGHGIALKALGLDPLLDLKLRLGEGTGAVLAMPLVEAAARLLDEMATFEEAGVSDRPAPA